MVISYVVYRAGMLFMLAATTSYCKSNRQKMNNLLANLSSLISIDQPNGWVTDEKTDFLINTHALPLFYMVYPKYIRALTL